MPEPKTHSLDSTLQLPSVVLDEIRQGALPIAQILNMPNLSALDEGSLGDLPWFWQSGLNFNALTYDWINSLFAFSGGFVGTNGQALMTAYSNVLADIAFVLDAADAEALNNADLAAAAIINTLLTDWTTTQGPFPAEDATQAQQLNFIMDQVISWGAPDLTLAQLRVSTNPLALLPNIPLGADQIVNDLMSYLSKTGSVANIQNAAASFNAQLNATRANADPQPAPTTVTPGFMQIIDRSGNTQIVPAINIAESTAQIQNALVPGSGGRSFSVEYTVEKLDSSTLQVSSASGGVGVGPIAFLLLFVGSSSSTDSFSFDSSLVSCTLKLTFNGVTTLTPTYAKYNISTGAGWWNPAPIEEAANPVPNQSGYQFTPTPSFDFGVNGNFGVISRLLISQQPVLSVTYSTNDIQKFDETFSSESTWGINFLGIGLGGGSSSYYQSQVSQNTAAGTITLTMSPVGISEPVTPIDQLAYVIGADILWPGASTLQNLAAI